MPQIIKNIHIENFKSAKNVELTDCKRINLLIGKPNVGKSNLLEALSLFCLPFLKYLKKKDLQQFIKVENISELFCNGNIENEIKIQADNKKAVLKWLPQNGIEVNLQYSPTTEEISLPFSSTLAFTKKIYLIHRTIRSAATFFLLLSVRKAVYRTYCYHLPVAI